MAQILSPAELNGSGTLNSEQLAPSEPSITELIRTAGYRYYFDTLGGMTDWNLAINAASSQAADGSLQITSATESGRGGISYITGRLLIQYDLSEIVGNITSISLGFSTNPLQAASSFDVNIYNAGTTLLGGTTGEYSYYKDEGSTAFSTPQSMSPNTSYTFSLNAAALTIANTKPTNFVIALISEFDYTSTAPSPAGTFYELLLQEPYTIPLTVTSY